MISIGEIQRIAGTLGLEPRVIDLDYVLGCYLCFLCNQSTVQKKWLFKGGTALRKCYFEEYRFSEDLDFTVLGIISVENIRNILHSANIEMQDTTGIRTDERETVVDVIEDDYGKESYEARIYYFGPWDYGGSPRSIRIHTNRDESLAFPANRLSIFHQYSDREELPAATIQVYSLEEMMAEKLRAFSGQRKQAIPHDIFDLYHLSRNVESVDKVLEAFPQKCQAKGISLKAIDLDKVMARKSEYENNWRQGLEYLLPANLKVSFEVAWYTSIRLLEKASQKKYKVRL
ncbi:MAG: nucleotidyl transferase AbiEii/AbiGii toxin family protein [Candidatus Aminicenantes bacterium]|nr:nucleotidyl transferase AbiEii/AbiGii toxin family protein [Candidatus Aminicenantes bacterium]MDH5384252.1 nucleotidyl transferase AbiEii/AbiGii toxin family protein [Candidatus Aminicenantes bacterium]MDH5743234.1 nucleotidyl transferase AbiEii/AbiGii toxin family protein [Candidatus Aminicenantes bacterium]